MFKSFQIIICILVILACTAMTGGAFLIIAAAVISFLLIGYFVLRILADKNSRSGK